MLADFDKAVLGMIGSVGTVGVYEERQALAYNPATAETTTSSKSQAVKCVLLDLTLQSNGLSTKYGTEIVAGDKEAYVIPPQKTGGSAIKITPGSDKLTIAGVAYTVVTFKEVNPTGADPIVYFLYLRR